MHPNIPKIKAPKGYKFKVSKYYRGVIIYLLHGDYNIGSIRLSLSHMYDNTFYTHSYLDHCYRGKGLGTLMYARAIQWALEHGKKVQSSYTPSVYARRVWNSQGLRKYFRIIKGKSAWFAHPKLTKK